MKLLSIFFYFFLTLSLSLATKCDEEPCTCGDFMSLDYGDPSDKEFIDGGNCAFSLKCVSRATVEGHFSSSEIEQPANSLDYFLIYANDTIGDIDFYGQFGVICDDDEWKITKYPTGIEYYTDQKFEVMDIVNAPKTVIKSFQCF